MRPREHLFADFLAVNDKLQLRPGLSQQRFQGLVRMFFDFLLLPSTRGPTQSHNEGGPGRSTAVQFLNGLDALTGASTFPVQQVSDSHLLGEELAFPRLPRLPDCLVFAQASFLFLLIPTHARINTYTHCLAVSLFLQTPHTHTPSTSYREHRQEARNIWDHRRLCNPDIRVACQAASPCLLDGSDVWRTRFLHRKSTSLTSGLE